MKEWGGKCFNGCSQDPACAAVMMDTDQCHRFGQLAEQGWTESTTLPGCDAKEHQFCYSKPTGACKATATSTSMPTQTAGPSSESCACSLEFYEGSAEIAALSCKLTSHQFPGACVVENESRCADKKLGDNGNYYSLQACKNLAVSTTQTPKPTAALAIASSQNVAASNLATVGKTTALFAANDTSTTIDTTAATRASIPITAAATTIPTPTTTTTAVASSGYGGGGGSGSGFGTGTTTVAAAIPTAIDTAPAKPLTQPTTRVEPAPARPTPSPTFTDGNGGNSGSSGNTNPPGKNSGGNTTPPGKNSGGGHGGSDGDDGGGGVVVTVLVVLVVLAACIVLAFFGHR